MPCRRADDIDFEGFLVDSSATEFDEFRIHYADCADCADAVARWSALDLALRDVMAPDAGADATHPEAEQLEAFLTSPASLAGSAAIVERHLSSCSSCQTEVQLMRRFDPEALRVASGIDLAAAADEGSIARGFSERLQALGTALGEALFGSPTGRLVLPAAAAAALVLAGLWWSGSLVTGDPAASDAPPSRVVERRTPPVEPPSERGPRESGVLLAEEPATRTVEDAAVPEVIEAAPSEPERLAADDRPSDLPPGSGAEAGTGVVPPPEPQRMAELSEPPTEAVEDDTDGPGGSRGASPVASDEMLLAALTDMPLPDYAKPGGADSLLWMRQFGPVRSGTRALQVATRAPADHAGLTLSASPRLWWLVEETIEQPLQVTVVDEEALEPILRIDLSGPHTTGLHSIDLMDHGVRLESGREYRWFVSVLVDPNRPSRNPISAGALRVIDAADARRVEVDEAPASARGHRLAQLGIWYDAYDFFASLAEANPQVEGLAAYRDRLVDLAGADR